MNRALFITAGIFLVIVTVAVWGFLLINGKPKTTSEIFSNLGIVPDVPQASEDSLFETEDATETNLDLSDGKLQQITTNAIAGFGIASSSNQTIVRYAELGTGHLYEINLNLATERTLAPYTLTHATEAYFSPNLSQVVIVTNGEGREVFLHTIVDTDEGTLETTKLPNDAENIQFISDSELLFTRNTALDTALFTYNLEEGTVQSQRTIPLPDATIVYNDSTTYGYPRPTKLFTGALYEINNSTVSPVSATGLALSATIDNQTILITELVDGQLLSKTYLTDEAQNIITLPEKCTGNGAGQLWCGAPTIATDADYLENWYKGKLQSDDDIWSIDTTSGVTTKLVSPKTITGRIIDVLHPKVDESHSKLLFTNKTDRTLWLLNL